MKFKSLENLPIRAKLNFLVVFTAGFALAVSSWTLRFSAGKQFEHALISELQSLGKLVAQAAEGNIRSNDKGSTQHLLDALQVKPNILGAAVLTADGQPIASYVRAGENPAVFPALPQEFGVHCGPSRCHAIYPIESGKSLLGQIVLVSDLRGLSTALQENAKTLSLTFLGSIAIALLVSSFFGTVISGPLRQLAALAENVSSRRDYSLRIPIEEKPKKNAKEDEISTVVRGVNYMLDQIERRDGELTQAKNLAEQANQAKSQFVANTSHEIRTPINNIVGFAEILAGSLKGPEEQRYVELIQDSADSLLGIINDLLDISRIESGRLELDRSASDLRAHLEKILTPFEALATKSGLTFELHIDESLPKYLDVDSIRFGQVMMNLVNNIAKFPEPPGKIKVDLEVLRKSERDVEIAVSVKDFGVRVREDVRMRIEEMFRRVESSAAKEYGGTGLGLAISQRIVGLLGGRLTLDSKPGRGSIFAFQVRVPVTGSLGVNLPSISTTLSASIGGSSKTNETEKFQVLVVEDNPMSREITVHRLKRLGFTVLTANDGEQAIQIAGSNSVDLILMDCQMPSMDGFQATAQIRALEKSSGKRIPIVALTAHAMEGYREACINAGMDDYLTKPIHEAQLVEFLRRLPAANTIFGIRQPEDERSEA